VHSDVVHFLVAWLWYRGLAISSVDNSDHEHTSLCREIHE